MDFRTQRYFMTVAEELNFSHAAKRLQMSQPPLSNTIKELEQELGVTLFIRGRRHLQLTPAGALLMRRTAQILELAEKTKTEMASFGQEMTGKIFVATVDGRAARLCAVWIAGFRSLYPNITFDLWNGSTEDVIMRMEAGIADIGIVPTPYDTEHYEGFAVGREPWVAIMSGKHSLAKNKESAIRLSVLKDEVLILPQGKQREVSMMTWFESAGVRPKTQCTLSNYEEAITMAEHGAGISIFPMTTTHVPIGVVVKTIITPARYAEYALVRAKGSMLPAIADTFVQYIQDVLKRPEKKPADQGDPFRVPRGAKRL